MSTEGSDDNQNLPVYVEEEVPSFLRKDSEFSKLIKYLEKPAKEAIEVLRKLMVESKDEKIKQMAARDLLNFLLAAKKEHNTDQMQRLIAHCKLVGRGTGNLVPAPDENNPTGTSQKVVVDFTNIRTLE
jgi:hypothetical protein